MLATGSREQSVVIAWNCFYGVKMLSELD